MVPTDALVEEFVRDTLVEEFVRDALVEEFVRDALGDEVLLFRNSPLVEVLLCAFATCSRSKRKKRDIRRM